MTQDMTRGSIVKGLARFSLPLVAANLLQQCYNIADTLIVGRVLGEEALAAVGAAYSLMTFLNSVLIGLCMGMGAYLSIQFGARDDGRFRRGRFAGLVLIGALALCLTAGVYLGLGGILRFLHVPAAVIPGMREYLLVIFAGIVPVFLYNYYACVLRAVGDSATPLVFLAGAAILNVGLDLLLVAVLSRGIAGAAWATLIAQCLSGAGLGMYCRLRRQELRLAGDDCRLEREVVLGMGRLSLLTCLQQGIMNFGILLVQGLVNRFGASVMAAFAAAVKIDTFAYAPAQDFGNAFSTFVAQNHGAGKPERIRAGLKRAAAASGVFCLAVSGAVFCAAEGLMGLFVEPTAGEIIAIGAEYLRIEGAFYPLIGFLFLFYGYFRAVERPGVSVVLTVLSLGTRVALAWALCAVPALGVRGIWMAVPIGWALADAAGLFFLLRGRKAAPGGR